MREHIDALGMLHRVWGLLSVLAGFSLLILSAGTWFSLVDLAVPSPAGRAGVGLLVTAGVLFLAGGAAMWATGSAIARRRPAARQAALVLAVPNLVLAPFGTALGIYTCWVLLNDDGRRAFGRAPRA